jgi:hypothetical protein
MSSADPIKSAEDMNKTTGAAMALIKKIDVDKYFAAKRAMRLARIWPVSQPVAAGTVPAAKRKRVPAPAEALTLEHFSPSVSSAPIPIIDSGRNRLLRPPGSRQE